MRALIRILSLGLLLVSLACAAFGTTIPDAKRLADNQPVTLSAKVVTYVGAGFFYIEEASGSMGIRVEKASFSLTVGMKADVSGDMKTNSANSERYIQAASAVQSGTLNPNDAIKPVGMNNRAIGGGAWQVAGTGGQVGASGSSGLNNIGLLVRTWGKFHQIDATTFTVNDGSGPSIRCTVPAGTFISSAWQCVAVTGISSLCDTSYAPLLLVRNIDVITPVEAVSTPGTPSGDASPLIGLSYGYSTTGSTCSQGHPIEYSFSWGDGTAQSPWSTSTVATHAWTTAGVKLVTVTARCQTHPTVAALSAMSVTPVTQVASNPWPMFRHDLRHSGVSPYHDPAGVATAWTVSVGSGSGLSSPVIAADGTIYIGGVSALYALKGDGSVKWSPAINSTTRSTPAIAPNGNIYIGGNGRLYAFNSAGTQKWYFTVSGDVTSSPAVGADNTVYIGSRGGYLYALTPGTSSATQKWRYSTGDMHMTSPVLSADGATIYTGGGSYVHAVNTANGAARWTYYLGIGMTSSAALSPDGSTVYIGAYDGNLYAINAANGSLIWQVPVGFKNAVTSASPAIGSDGTIYLGSNYGSLYAINPDGSQKWIFESKTDIRSSVAINADGTVILASYDGYVRGLDSATGVEKWHHLLPGNNYASPAIAPNGRIVTATMSGNVYGNIGGTPPGAIPPSDLTASLSPDNAQAILSWHDNSSDEFGFRIERRVGTTGSWTALPNSDVTKLPTVGIGATAYTDSGLLSGKTYYYRVCAFQAGGNSDYTNEARVTTPGMQVPDDLVATPVSATQVNLAWIDMSSDEAGFSIERSVGTNGLFEEIARVGANVSAYTDTNTYPARYYYYRVRSFNSSLNYSSYSNWAYAYTGDTTRDFPEIWHGDTSRRQIALTFDAGTAAIQTNLLDTLKANNVFSNFFITGYVTEVQGSIVNRIGTDGHFIGNHTYDHPDLRYVPDDEAIRQFNSTEDIIYNTSGHHTRPYFRAPYGAKNQHVLDVAASDGFQHVNWSVDTGDSMGATTQQIIDRAEGGAANGAIILFHCTAPNTAAAIPTIIPHLKAQGYELVTIPELVAPKQVTSPAGYLNAGWNLISLPIEPALEFPHIVFRGIAIDTNLRRWDKATASEVTYSAASPWLFGNLYSDEGYWLYAPSGATVKLNGSAATSSRRIKLPQTTNPSAYALIGYPFETAQSFSNCQVYNPNSAAPQTRPLLEAISLGWIPGTFYAWNSATQTQYDVNLSTAQLDPWRGYRAAALVAGVELIIPKP